MTMTAKPPTTPPTPVRDAGPPTTLNDVKQARLSAQRAKERYANASRTIDREQAVLMQAAREVADREAARLLLRLDVEFATPATGVNAAKLLSLFLQKLLSHEPVKVDHIDQATYQMRQRIKARWASWKNAEQAGLTRQEAKAKKEAE